MNRALYAAAAVAAGSAPGGGGTSGPAGTDESEWVDWVYATDDGNITESSGDVSAWDGVEGVLSLSASGSDRPDLIADGGSTWNNQQVIDFNGSSEWLDAGVESVGAVDLFATAGAAQTIIFAARAQVGTYIAKAGATSGNRTFQLYKTTSGGGNFFTYIRGSQTTLASADTNAHVFALVIDGASVDCYIDGGSAISCNVGSASEESQNINIGSRTDGSFLLNGEIYFVGLRANIASSSILNTVGADLAADIGTTWTTIS